MACCATITDIAQLIHTDLGSPDDLSLGAIQSKLISPAYVGKINNLAATCYVSVSGCIEPALCPAVQAIYGAQYEVDYYTAKLNQTLAGYNTSFVTLVEGDSRVTRASTVDVARVYRDMQKQLNDQLGMLIASYRQLKSLPESIIYPTILNTYGYGSGPAYWPQNYYRS